MNYPDKPFVIDYPIDAGRDNPFLPIGSDSSVNQGVRVQDRQATTTGTSTASSTIIATTTKPILKKF